MFLKKVELLTPMEENGWLTSDRRLTEIPQHWMYFNEFCTNIYGPQRMNPKDFGDPLSFPQAWTFFVFSEISRQLPFPPCRHSVVFLFCLPVMFSAFSMWHSVLHRNVEIQWNKKRVSSQHLGYFSPSISQKWHWNTSYTCCQAAVALTYFWLLSVIIILYTHASS